MNLALSFYKTAKTDLKAAQLLHINQDYPNAIFHFQQSVEKLSKAFGLENKIIKNNNDISKKISHNSAKVFTTQINEMQEEFDNMSKVEDLFPDFFKFEVEGKSLDFSGYNEQFRNSSSQILNLKADDFLEIENDELDDLIISLNQINPNIKIDIEKLGKDFPKLWKSIIIQIEEKTGKNLQEVYDLSNNQEFIDKLGITIKEVIPLTLKLMSIYSILFMLSLLTSGHNQTTRYPCIHCGELPQQKYRKKTPIVNRFNDLIKLLRKAMNYYEDLYIKESIFNNK